VDAVLFVTPEYDRSIPGALKNAIDWASRPSAYSPLMNSIEAYIQFEDGLISEDGSVSDRSTKEFLQNYMSEFHSFIARVYTVLPRNT
jgi:chromate reductase